MPEHRALYRQQVVRQLWRRLSFSDQHVCADWYAGGSLKALVRIWITPIQMEAEHIRAGCSLGDGSIAADMFLPTIYL